MDLDLMRRRREQREAFLARLYDAVDASVTTFVNAWEVADALGIAAAEAKRVVEYHAEKGLVLVDDYRSGTVRLTAAGVDHVERGQLGE